MQNSGVLNYNCIIEELGNVNKKKDLKKKIQEFVEPKTDNFIILVM